MGLRMRAIVLKQNIRRRSSTPFTKVTDFVLNLDDAKAYLYKDSTKHRIHRWQDLKVNIYV